MMTQEFGLRPTSGQRATLESWMRTCCWIYNQALEHRIKAYSRRKESVTYRQQQSLLVKQRSRVPSLAETPSDAERDALRRVDRGMKAFFRRCKAGENPGFPRFRSYRQYNSLEFFASNDATFIRGNYATTPKLGLIKIRAGKQVVHGKQKLLRIIRRASGWYGQVVVDCVKPIRNLEDHGPIGIDVGLESFATQSNGENIENPRFYMRSQKQRAGIQRSLARKKKGSNNRRKARIKLARHEENVSLQRRNFCHQHSTELVRKHPVIAVENLNIKGMVKCRSFSKSISDAGWSIFLQQLKVKAENAGRQVIAVNPSGTSQTCPNCGAVKKKELRERTHSCGCGLVIDRDHAAACVILARALEATGATRLRRDSTAGSTHVVSS